MSDEKQTKFEFFERHAPTVLAAVITALLLWIGATTQATQVSVAELRVEIRGIRSNATRLEQLDDRVRDLERGHQ